MKFMIGVFPAYAGMIPRRSWCTGLATCVPRIRGDDPADGGHSLAVMQCSPHTRG